MLRLRGFVVVMIVAVMMINVVPYREAAIGRKIDNYLNNNMPFLTLDYEVQAYEYDDYDPYTRYMINQGFAWGSLGVEYYDEMDAEEKMRVDALDTFEDMLGVVGGIIGAVYPGVKATQIAAKAAEKMVISEWGQYYFGGTVSYFTGGIGEAFGSY